MSDRLTGEAMSEDDRKSGVEEYEPCKSEEEALMGLLQWVLRVGTILEDIEATAQGLPGQTENEKKGEHHG